jgi:anthranilate synthase/aminodeoxychorismate synthase-like glutamine amidotransferase
VTVLLIDAYDSFVYIIDHYLQMLDLEVTVRRNDQVSPELIEQIRPDAIVLGPGPGHPSEANYLPIIHRFAGKLPIFGVCLGHQAIGLAFGAEVGVAKNLMHGRTSEIEHDGQGCFTGLPNPFTATRYHSLIVHEASITNDLIVTARSDGDGYVMGMRHRTHMIESVQFHPESILTRGGLQIFSNFFERAAVPRKGALATP